jgi:isoleucyl-tRNA synthetase
VREREERGVGWWETKIKLHHTHARTRTHAHILPLPHTRPQVFAMGIAKYNAHCRSIVTRYTKEWERTVTRIGRWIDFKNDYKTLGASVEFELFLIFFF